jgi:DNA polymerase I
VSKTPPLVLVDGSSYLYRAFHALPRLTNSKGEPTGAVYGVANMLRKLLKDYGPEHVVVVFDAKGRTFRDDLYAEYKANRPPMPDELAAQVEPLHELVRAMGLPMLVVPGVEADDVIATLAREGREHGLDVVISTGDKDLAQLVEPGVTLVNTMTDTTMDPAGVREKFGVPPERVVDYLALIGDTVDNVPGVDSVGPKTAARWIEAYGSLEGVMAHADEIKGKVGDNLRAALDHLPLSRELVTVRRDVELVVTPEGLRLGEPDRETLRQLLARLEFRTWLRELESEGGETDADTARSAQAYQTILDKNALETWIKRLEAAEVFAFDTETTGLDYMQARVVGVSFAVTPGEAAYLPLAHDYADAPQQLPRDATLERLRPLLEDPRRPKVGQHLKYDRNVLLNHGIELAASPTTPCSNPTCSTAPPAATTWTRWRSAPGYRTIHYEDVAGKGSEADPLLPGAHRGRHPLRRRGRRHHPAPAPALWPQLEAAEAVPGVPGDRDAAGAGAGAHGAQRRAGGRGPAAPRATSWPSACGQLGAARPTRWPAQPSTSTRPSRSRRSCSTSWLPVLKKTPKGQPSTNEDVLEELADYAAAAPDPGLPLLAKLQVHLHRQAARRCDQSRTGRVHTSYHQAVAATGRLSSSDPEPAEHPDPHRRGPRIRQAFIAPPGRLLVAADYSQIELRIMAHLSGDEGLLKAFAPGRTSTAPPPPRCSACRSTRSTTSSGARQGDQLRPHLRHVGVRPGAPARHRPRRGAGLHRPLLRPLSRRARLHGRTREQARDQGYVETVFGRRLYLPKSTRQPGAQRRRPSAPSTRRCRAPPPTSSSAP